MPTVEGAGEVQAKATRQLQPEGLHMWPVMSLLWVGLSQAVCASSAAHGKKKNMPDSVKI